MLTILHASDLQCGRPFLPRAADALVEFARDSAPDVVVVSGDLTQRAKRREFRTAVALLARLPRVPTVVTPGNHDVPLWRVWERVLMPYRNWREVFPAELDTVTRVPGATFVALNSSAPRRAIVNGRLDPDQVDFARSVFVDTSAADLRALVIHHHFVPTPGGEGGRPLPGARDSARAFESMGVDLVLGGHVHQIHVRTSRDLSGDGSLPGIPFVACGTTTSRRGRGHEVGRNSLHVIRVGAGEIEVSPHMLAAGTDAFEPVERIVLPRARARPSASAGRAGA